METPKFEQTPESKGRANEKAPEDKGLLKQKGRALVDDLLKGPEWQEATELSSRRKPEVKLGPNDRELTPDTPEMRAFLETILSLAKKNMKNGSPEYGDTSEITPDNTSFVLSKSGDEFVVYVSVRGLSSKAVIGQSGIKIAELQGQEIVFNTPPLKETDIEAIWYNVNALA